MNVLDIARRNPEWSAGRDASGWYVTRIPSTYEGFPKRLVIRDEDGAGTHTWHVLDHRDGALVDSGVASPADALRAVNKHAEEWFR